MLRSGCRGDDPSRVVTDEVQGGHAHQPEHREYEHHDDRQSPTAFVRHPFCLHPRHVHPWIIGPPAPPLEGTSPGPMNDTNCGPRHRAVARPCRFLGQPPSAASMRSALRGPALAVAGHGAMSTGDPRARPPGGGPGVAPDAAHISHSRTPTRPFPDRRVRGAFRGASRPEMPAAATAPEAPGQSSGVAPPSAVD